MTYAIYIRTSTEENDGEAQIHELRKFAEGSGWGATREYIDRGVSGTKDTRPEWDRLQRDVRRGAVTAWAATELARLGRGGVLQVAPFLKECCDRGCRVVLTRAGLDYSTPVGRLVANILLEVAAMERSLITERVRAGVRRAQEKGTRSGKAIGRPRARVDVEEVRRMLAQGFTWAQIAQEIGASQSTARRATRACQNPT